MILLARIIFDLFRVNAHMPNRSHFYGMNGYGDCGKRNLSAEADNLVIYSDTLISETEALKYLLK